AHRSPCLEEFQVGRQVVCVVSDGQGHGLASEFARVFRRFHILLLHAVFLGYLLSDLLQTFKERFQFGRSGSFRPQELDHVARKTPVRFDSLNVAPNEIVHVGPRLHHPPLPPPPPARPPPPPPPPP